MTGSKITKFPNILSTFLLVPKKVDSLPLAQREKKYFLQRFSTI